MKVSVETTDTIEETYNKVRNGEIDVKGKAVILDCMTNDVRRTTPPEMARRTGMLLDIFEEAETEAVVVCEVKPIRHLDVRPFNEALHSLLSTRKGTFGCHTQIRMDHLARDGFRVSQRNAGIIDRTYACAIIGIPVPDPTPPEEFDPDFDHLIREWLAVKQSARRAATRSWVEVVKDGLRRMSSWSMKILLFFIFFQFFMFLPLFHHHP